MIRLPEGLNLIKIYTNLYLYVYMCVYIHTYVRNGEFSDNNLHYMLYFVLNQVSPFFTSLKKPYYLPLNMSQVKLKNYFLWIQNSMCYIHRFSMALKTTIHIGSASEANFLSVLNVHYFICRNTYVFQELMLNI